MCSRADGARLSDGRWLLCSRPMGVRLGWCLALLAPILVAQDKETAVRRDQWHDAGRGNGIALFGPRGSVAQADSPAATAIAAGLAWLKKVQADDGHWNSGVEGDGADRDVAVTALALLAMLGEGNTLRVGTFKNPLKLGIQWLRTRQSDDGAFAQATGPHMLATLAMTECYLVSSYTLIRPNAERGLAFLATRRSEDGGWRATAASTDSDPALTLWGMAVLGTARAGELLKGEHPYEGVEHWLAGRGAGQIADSSVLGVAAPAARQPELAFDQQMANAFTRCWLAAPDAKAADLERARSLPRVWAAKDGVRLSIHEWYCSSHALAQAGDEATLARIAESLVAAQVTSGNDLGSWAPIGVFGEAGGRVWTTAMAVMTLGAGHRYGRGIAQLVH